MATTNNVDIELVKAILSFLEKKSRESSMTDEQAESITVACQCIESAFNLDNADENRSSFEAGNALTEAFKKFYVEQNKMVKPIDAEKAVQLKNEGNELMRLFKYQDAVDRYTEAIRLDGTNPVYYCNRAAAYLSMSKPDNCVKDCEEALRIDPNYGKAYGRMGAAYLLTKDKALAINSLQMALQYDPNNENARENMKRAQSLPDTNENPSSSDGRSQLGGASSANPTGANFDFNSILQNPQLLNLASQMMSNPQVQDMIGGVLGDFGSGQAAASPDGSGQSSMNPNLQELLRAGQQMAATISSSNPELIDSIRRSVQRNEGPRSNGPSSQNPPSQNDQQQ
ncbi:hypothetical protein GJ496_005450 [Pomphorhynchus laevis]|nr:hypothetical protein GJ496_005450 [Pomphorhynchus laevis]